MLTERQVLQIQKEQQKIEPKKYDTSYLNKKCSKCGEKKTQKGSTQIRYKNGTRKFICADCRNK